VLNHFTERWGDVAQNKRCKHITENHNGFLVWLKKLKVKEAIICNRQDTC